MNMKINNFMMRKLLIAFLFTVISIGNANAQNKNTFWLGADISGTTQLESNGEKLYNAKGVI